MGAFEDYAELLTARARLAEAKENAVQSKLEFETRKPKYCSKSGCRLRFYWCHNCRSLHWPYRIIVKVVE